MWRGPGEIERGIGLDWYACSFDVNRDEKNDSDAKRCGRSGRGRDGGEGAALRKVGLHLLARTDEKSAWLGGGGARHTNGGLRSRFPRLDVGGVPIYPW